MKGDPKDSLGRRKRYAGRQPKGEKVKLLDTYVDGIFMPLQRHGILGSNYLHEFRMAITGRRDRYTLLDILRKMYNETKWIDRPKGQKKADGSDYQNLAYVLDEAGYQALGSKIYQYGQRADLGWFHHQWMTSSITASIELTCFKYNFGYGDQEAILTHALCPDETRNLERPLELHLRQIKIYDRKTGAPKMVWETVIPDQLFKIEYPTNIKFFALEADRASEDHDTIKEKLRKWVYALEHEIPRKQWGTPSLIVLVVTTDEKRMRKMMGFLRELTDDTDPFLFQYEEHFADSFTTPPVMPKFLEEKWYRADGTMFSLLY